MGKALRAAGLTLASCVVIVAVLIVVFDKGPLTRWLVPTILIVVGVAIATWLRERRSHPGR
jgi:hypothetical protein